MQARPDAEGDSVRYRDQRASRMSLVRVAWNCPYATSALVRSNCDTTAPRLRSSRHANGPHIHSHRTPRVLAMARHYIRDVVCGANDGIIATFAYWAGRLVATAVGEAVF